MQILRVSSLDSAFDAPRGGVVTLGVFDGVHLGHRHLLARLVKEARARGAPAIALTFAVHPVVVIKGLPPRSITALDHRLRLLSECGLDATVVLPFDEAVRDLSAEAFSQRVFVDALSARALVLGPDARVGKDRKGDLEFLRGFAARHTIDLVVVEPLDLGAERISSTRIRAAIADGDIERVAHMLGRPFALSGTVVKGLGRGRLLGFPTANLDLHHEIRPPLGVYAIHARLPDGRRIPGVLNIGIRPTFGPDGDLTVEAHLFDFAADLYGQEIELELVKRLRAERTFRSREELVEQIALDVAAARAATSR